MDIPTHLLDLFLAPGGRIDALAILFLVGSLTMLWALWIVIRDESPLTPPDTDGDA